MSLIVDILEHYGADVSRINPVRTGWQKIRCPWHDDSTASGSVNTDKGAYCCHACDMKGDAIALIKKIEGLDYIGALYFAREVLGQSIADLPRTTEKTKRKRPSARQRLFD